jgi:hypothetical protein
MLAEVPQASRCSTEVWARAWIISKFGSVSERPKLKTTRFIKRHESTLYSDRERIEKFSFVSPDRT